MRFYVKLSTMSSALPTFLFITLTMHIMSFYGSRNEYFVECDLIYSFLINLFFIYYRLSENDDTFVLSKCWM